MARLCFCPRPAHDPKKRHAKSAKSHSLFGHTDFGSAVSFVCALSYMWTVTWTCAVMFSLLTHRVDTVCSGLSRHASGFFFFLALLNSSWPVLTQARKMPCSWKITVWQQPNTIAFGYEASMALFCSNMRKHATAALIGIGYITCLTPILPRMCSEALKARYKTH